MPHHLSPEELQEIDRSLERTESAPIELSTNVLELAESLSRIHGRIRVAQEESGLHFYMASPACLVEDGAIELPGGRNMRWQCFTRVGD